MGRPVTLFTGQWADLKLEELCKKAKDFGYDGLELACWGDHFEVDKALSDDTYCARKRELLEKYDLQVFAISNHLVGQAVLDNIDARHKSILPPAVWGDGKPDGVNQRASEEMKNTARAAQKLGVGIVNGFTGSSVWHLIYDFPPTPKSMYDDGFKLLAERWNPILDVFQECGVKFALARHLPSRIHSLLPESDLSRPYEGREGHAERSLGDSRQPLVVR
jgi:sugar phosphate isomerase/epimerase